MCGMVYPEKATGSGVSVSHFLYESSGNYLLCFVIVSITCILVKRGKLSIFGKFDVPCLF